MSDNAARWLKALPENGRDDFESWPIRPLRTTEKKTNYNQKYITSALASYELLLGIKFHKCKYK